MKAIAFDVAMLRTKPPRYRFFARGENVLFGDERQVIRFDSDPDYADRTGQIRWCGVSYGDFHDAKTAQWLADTLNKAVGR